MVLRLNRGMYSNQTERYQKEGLSPAFLDDMAEVIEALEDAGFSAYDQLTGYVRTGNERFITRNGGAREIVMKMDHRQIKAFLKIYKNET